MTGVAEEEPPMTDHKDDPALQPKTRQDPRWHERIELAKIVREQSRKAREGKQALPGMRRRTS